MTYPRQPSTEQLAHIPGEEGLPLIGNTLSFIRDSRKLQQKLYQGYGIIYRTKSFGSQTIGLLGPDANELLLMNKGEVFSSGGGWRMNLQAFFNRGLMLLDFDEHKYHRRIMQTAFRKEAMQSYVEGMNITATESLNRWRDIPLFECYSAIKKWRWIMPYAFLLVWNPETMPIRSIVLLLIQLMRQSVFFDTP